MTVKSSYTSVAFLVFAVLITVTGVTAAAIADSRDEVATPNAAAQQTVSPSVATIDRDLTEAEADGILYMREEEKLARDVYLGLGDLWDLRVFDNIAAAEQRHMDEVFGLVDVYGLEDPETSAMVGVFDNDDLQTLYDGLMAMGSESVEAALEVGATIEEVDIADLDEYLAETTAPDITMVYENLLRGSRNHLRAFVRQLESAGISREATVLDSTLFESIVNSSNERGAGGSVDHDGCAESGVGEHGDGTGEQRRSGQGGGRGSGDGRVQGGGGRWGGGG